MWTLSPHSCSKRIFLFLSVQEWGLWLLLSTGLYWFLNKVSRHVQTSPSPTLPQFPPSSLFSPFGLLNLIVNVDPRNTDFHSEGLHLLDTSGKCSMILTCILINVDVKILSRLLTASFQDVITKSIHKD